MKLFAVFIVVLIVSLTLLVVFSGAFKSKAIRVACIGDSITELSTYPTDLQELLGSHYYVREFAISGTTVLTDSYNPYIYQPKFQVAKIFTPDIVVILLGTNDARANISQSIDKFVADYKQLVSEVQELETKPKILLVTPPPIFENAFDLHNESLLEYIIPAIEQVAEEFGLTLVDVYTALAAHPDYFMDGIHPDYDGANVIANEVYKAI